MLPYSLLVTTMSSSMIGPSSFLAVLYPVFMRGVATDGFSGVKAYSDEEKLIESARFTREMNLSRCYASKPLAASL